MDKIKITPEHKDKIIEMCHSLYPEYEINKSIVNSTNSNFILYVFDGNVTIWFHWFEFCVLHLVNKLNISSAGLFNKLEEEFTNVHIVDYLYEKFKSLNKK